MDGTLVQNLNVMNVPSRRRNPVIADILYAINGWDVVKEVVKDVTKARANQNLFVLLYLKLCLENYTATCCRILWRSIWSTLLTKFGKVQHCCPNYDGTKGGTNERFDTLYIVIDNHKCNSRYIIKKSYSKSEYYCDLCRCNCLNTVETILKLSVERWENLLQIYMYFVRNIC